MKAANANITQYRCRIVGYLESGVQIKLQGIDAQGGAVDRVRTHVTQTHPDTVRKTIVSDDVVARGIGAAPLEIRVRIGIDDRVALQITIADHAAPGTRRHCPRVAQAD